MKSILLSALVCGGISSAFADVVTPESTGFKFTDTKVVPTTSIKNQSETGTCWCFSVVAFLENEIIRTSGKSVDLSEMFVVRNLYPEKAQKFMRMEGEIRFNQGGGVKDVLYAWDKYGMVPESVYSGLNYGEEIPDNWLWSPLMNVPLDEMEQIVDNAIMNGYSVAWAADMSEKSWQWDNGYAILPQLKTEANMTAKEKERWKRLPDADRESVLYDFFGPQPEIEVTQEVRQQMFDSFETVDDHLMVIVGLAKDQKGNKYYKVKNSFGTNQIYDGYIYISSAYFRAKTIDIMVHKDGVPASVQSKIVK